MSRRLVLIVAVFALAFAAGAAAYAYGNPPSAPADRRTVAAPIDGLDVRVLESAPPQYVVNVKAGLPSGCARQHSHSVSRSGDTITVTVLNSMPSGNVACTMIYGSYELNINLGSSFTARTTYTLRVNDKTTTFTAQ
jgi:hypothetical protein